MEAGGGGRAVREGGGAGEDGEQQSATTIRWKPDEKCLEMLLAMGIDRNSAIKGLYYTGNYSAEFAASYLFDNPDMDDDSDACVRIVAEDPEEPVRNVRAHDSDDETSRVQHFRMVFVINSNINMDTGKIAIQVGHASVALYRRLNQEAIKFGNQLSIWEEEGERKEVVKGQNDSHLMLLDKQAVSSDLVTFIVRDDVGAEVTEDTITILGIFGREDTVSSIIGNLPLL